MRNKKILALATASIITANMLPLNTLHIFADDTTEQPILQTTSVDASTYATTVRNLMAKIKLQDSQYGIVTNLNDNKVLTNGENSFSLKTDYNNYNVAGKGTLLSPYKYTGDIANQDDVINIDIKAKNGYIATMVPNLATSGQKYLSYDKNNLITSNTQIAIKPISTTKWGPGSLTDELSADLNTEITVKFSAKSDAQKITTEITGNGSITAPQELYYQNNEALIDKNSTHTFIINPGQNQEITATLNGNPVEISENNTVTIGQGHLKVEFTEVKETDKYDLNLSIGENGKVSIENKELIGTQSIKVSKEYETTIKPKANNGYYTSEVKLDGETLLPNEDGSYTLPTTNLEARNLEVIFSEKMKTSIQVDELRLPYTGGEQELNLNVIGENGEVIDTVKAIFTKKNILGQTINYKPVEIGNHNFKVTFAGNEKYKSSTLEGTLEIYDNRKNVTLELAEDTKVYNGEVQTFKANVLNENGEIVDTVNATYDFKAEHLLTPAGKNVGTYAITAKFNGDGEYRPAELKGSVEITKCSPKVSVENRTATYTGKPIKSDIVVTPKCGYIGIYTGVDRKLTPLVHIDLNLGDDVISKAISDLVNSMEINTVGDFKKIFENESLLKLLELAKIDISDVTKALKFLPDDMRLSFGAPVSAGAYISTAVVLDKNAEVKVGVGSLLIAKADRNIVFTEDSLASGRTIKPGQSYTHKVLVEGTDEEAEIKYTGLTDTFKTYLSTEAPQLCGTYTVTAHLKGDNNYRDAIVVRTFTIAKSATKIDLVSESNKVYDGNAYEIKTIVKDRDGNILENPTVKYTYYKGFRKLSQAPCEVGNYTVIATYSGDNANYGSTTSVKININK